jgi:uncharacterized membrane protein
MKSNIDVMMTVLLVVFIVSFVVVLIYGELWRINLSTEGAPAPLDIGRAQIAFIASCVGIATGASMLYITETKFAKDERKHDAVLTSSHS